VSDLGCIGEQSLTTTTIRVVRDDQPFFCWDNFGEKRGFWMELVGCFREANHPAFIMLGVGFEPVK
jgi:hypothetical protein